MNATRQIERIIAETLEREAKNYPETSFEYDKKAVFVFGNLTLRMKPNREAILSVAAKFKRGSNSPVGPRYTPKGTANKPFKMSWAYGTLKTVGPYNWRKT
jgi:hypothetical protein